MFFTLGVLCTFYVFFFHFFYLFIVHVKMQCLHLKKCAKNVQIHQKPPLFWGWLPRLPNTHKNVYEMSPQYPPPKGLFCEYLGVVEPYESCILLFFLQFFIIFHFFLHFLGIFVTIGASIRNLCLRAHRIVLKNVIFCNV